MKKWFSIKKLENFNTIYDSLEKSISIVCIVVTFLSSGYLFIANYISGIELTEKHYHIIILILVVVVFLVLFSLINNSKRYKNQLRQKEVEIKSAKDELEHAICMANEDKLLELDEAKRLLEHRQLRCFECIYKFARDFRNTINDIETYHKTITNNNDMLVTSISLAVKHFIGDALTSLTTLFEELTGERICACVKIIVSDDFKRIDYEDALVKTLIRSSNTAMERISVNDGNPTPVPLRENTDFMELVSKNRINHSSCFYQGNLVEYDKELQKKDRKYKNTTDKWEDYYVGTIVAPIRVANQHIHWASSEKGYDVLGFLCIDSKSTAAFPPDHKEDYCLIMKAFAAIIYNVLSKYQYYLKHHDIDCINVPNKSDSDSTPIKRTVRRFGLKK